MARKNPPRKAKTSNNYVFTTNEDGEVILGKSKVNIEQVDGDETVDEATLEGETDGVDNVDSEQELTVVKKTSRKPKKVIVKKTTVTDKKSSIKDYFTKKTKDTVVSCKEIVNDVKEELIESQIITDGCIQKEQESDSETITTKKRKGKKETNTESKRGKKQTRKRDESSEEEYIDNGIESEEKYIDNDEVAEDEIDKEEAIVKKKTTMNSKKIKSNFPTTKKNKLKQKMPKTFELIQNKEESEISDPKLVDSIYFRRREYDVLEVKEGEYEQMFQSHNIKLRIEEEKYELKSYDGMEVNGYKIFNINLSSYWIDFDYSGQYLAVAGSSKDKGSELKMEFNFDNKKGWIQIWDLKKMKLIINIRHNFSVLLKLKWWNINMDKINIENSISLGCLVVNGEDGKIRLFEIPKIKEEEEIMHIELTDESKNIIGILKHPEILYNNFELFSNNLLIAISLQGNIINYDLTDCILNQNNINKIPKFIAQPHHSPISYITLLCNKYLFTFSYDGKAMIQSLNDYEKKFKLHTSRTAPNNATTIVYDNQQYVLFSDQQGGIKWLHFMDLDLSCKLYKCNTYPKSPAVKYLASQYHHLTATTTFQGTLDLFMCWGMNTRGDRAFSEVSIVKVEQEDENEELQLSLLKEIPKDLLKNEKYHLKLLKNTQPHFLTKLYFNTVIWCQNKNKPFLVATTTNNGLLIVKDLKE
ncbi:hypothetical protein K502DRAFT_365101 [Neoconidiobolus thromboides FSU 785]|nr:hypothetical protein K502DRAFT_365101 [Neoconidiobolus thromboides FSU 785]